MQDERGSFDHLVTRCFGTRISDTELKQRINEHDRDGLTILHHVCNVTTPPWMTERLLREFGAQPDIMIGRFGYSPIFAAIAQYQLHHIRLLIAYGGRELLCKPCFVDPAITPLQLAFQLGKTSVAILLLDLGASYEFLLVLRGRFTEQEDLIIQHVRVIQAREKRALLTCCAIWHAQWLPRDMRRMLMCYVWSERRNDAWD